MSRKRPSRPSSVVRSWFTVRHAMLCATGHRISPGAAALYRRAGYLSSVLCARCAKEHLNLDPPPAKPFELADLNGDVKVQQAGDGKTERTSE